MITYTTPETRRKASLLLLLTPNFYLRYTGSPRLNQKEHHMDTNAKARARYAEDITRRRAKANSYMKERRLANPGGEIAAGRKI